MRSGGLLLRDREAAAHEFFGAEEGVTPSGVQPLVYGEPVAAYHDVQWTEAPVAVVHGEPLSPHSTARALAAGIVPARLASGPTSMH